MKSLFFLLILLPCFLALGVWNTQNNGKETIRNVMELLKEDGTDSKVADTKETQKRKVPLHRAHYPILCGNCQDKRILSDEESAFCLDCALLKASGYKCRDCRNKIVKTIVQEAFCDSCKSEDVKE